MQLKPGLSRYLLIAFVLHGGLLARAGLMRGDPQLVAIGAFNLILLISILNFALLNETRLFLICIPFVVFSVVTFSSEIFAFIAPVDRESASYDRRAEIWVSGRIAVPQEVGWRRRQNTDLVGAMANRSSRPLTWLRQHGIADLIGCIGPILHLARMVKTIDLRGEPKRKEATSDFKVLYNVLYVVAVAIAVGVYILFVQG
jgi:hypothetical protein